MTTLKRLFLSVDEAAHILSLKPSSVRNLLRRRVLRGSPDKRQWQTITAESVNDYLERHGSTFRIEVDVPELPVDLDLEVIQ